uniref:Aminotransferase-like plant mobile domain-containing protein n=1 Tax=Fagus sylvatica TaxID=28930 RepID=A0A2N9HUF2_FAGSY
MVRPRSACSPPRGDLIRHAAPPPNPPRFLCTYYFSTRFSGKLFEAFWCSKWVMRHIFGKIVTSTFQRYKVRANQSSDGRVMAPRSWGVRAVFSHFSGKDSGQMGDATGEPRVASRSWSWGLSNTLGLVDQITVSRREFAREGAPDVGFRRSWYRWKACATLTLKVQDLWETKLGLERYGPMNRGHQSVFSLPVGNFPIEIPARPGKILLPMLDFGDLGVAGKLALPSFLRSWVRTEASLEELLTIRELHVVAEVTLFLKGFSLRAKSLQVGKNLCANTASQIGGGQPNPAFGLVNALVKPRSNLVKLGQTSPNSGKCASDPVLRFFLMRWASVGSNRLDPGCFVLRADTRENPEGLRLTICQRLRVIQTRFGNSSKRSGKNWDLTLCRIAIGCLVRVAVVAASVDLIALRKARPWPMLRREHFDAEAASVAAGEAQPPLGPGITIGGSARSSGASRLSSRTPTGAPPVSSSGWHPTALPCHYSSDGYTSSHESHPPSIIFGSPLILVLRAPVEAGWSDFYKLLVGARREYCEFLMELGFGPFLDIPYVYVSHPLVRCWVERFFHHTGTFHFSTCDMGVLPVDWSAILGIRFGGRAPPSEPVSSPEALDILGIEDPSAIEGTKSTSLRLSYFLCNDKSTVPTPIVGMFRDVDTLREYDWGALTYRLPSAPDPAFPLARRWDSARIQRLTARTLLECRTMVDCIKDIDVVFQPYSSALVGRAELFEVVQLSRRRIWIRTPRSWELLMGERTVRQLGGDAIVPVEGVDFYPDLVRAEVVELWVGWPWTAITFGGDGPAVKGGGPAAEGDGPVAGRFGLAAEGGGLSGCGAGHSGCEHSESRGLALELGYCPYH